MLMCACSFQFRVPYWSEHSNKGNWRVCPTCNEKPYPKVIRCRPRAPRPRSLRPPGYRGAARSLNGIMAVMPPDRSPTRGRPAIYGRQHGFQPPHGRRAPPICPCIQRGALLHGRLARGQAPAKINGNRDRGFASSPVLQFVVHKGARAGGPSEHGPRAEDADNST